MADEGKRTIGADQPPTPAASLEDLSAFMQAVAANVSAYARDLGHRLGMISLEDDDHRKLKTCIAQSTAANYYAAARICIQVADERKG